MNDGPPIVTVITEDFNVRCWKWCNEDIANSVGREISRIISRTLKLINKPTHIIKSSFSCIDFIFCKTQNLISNYGVDLSIFVKCHHDIIFRKSTFTLSFLLPSQHRKDCSNFWLEISFWKSFRWWKCKPSKWNITKHFPKLYS